MNKKFPIKKGLPCQLKWNHSTVFLTMGTTASCHRVTHDPILVENGKINFHNIPSKLEARTKMLMVSGRVAAVKDVISKKFKDRKDLRHVVTFLNSTMDDPEAHLKDFIYYTKGTDRIREQKFGCVFPEFNEILVNNGVVI